MPLIQDSDLVDVLTRGDADDIGIVIDHITDKGKGRVSLSSEVCHRLTIAKSSGQIDEEVRAFVAEELQRYGGNSLVNLLRGGAGVSYREIVRDVADHVKATYNTGSSCGEIEIAILAKMLEQSIHRMSELQRRELFESFGAKYVAGPAALAGFLAVIKLSGFGTYQLATLVANATVKAILGRGLTLGASAGMMRGLGVLAGPLGWAITAIWTAFDLASPAYRITVPCVIQIAYMRQKALSNCCPACQAPVPRGARFCNGCGATLEQQLALTNHA